MTGALEWLCVSGLMVGQGAMDAVVDGARIKIGLMLRVDRRRATHRLNGRPHGSTPLLTFKSSPRIYLLPGRADSGAG